MMRALSPAILLPTVLLMAACAGPVRPERTAPPPLQPAEFTGTVRDDADSGPAPPRTEVLQDVTLAVVEQRAMAQHPSLAAARARIEAAKGRVYQAGRMPNPRAKVALEAGPLEDGNTVEDGALIVGVNQAIPTSDRLESATRVEEAETVARERELDALSVEVRRAARGAFATALHAQEIVARLTTLLEVAERRVELVRHRIAAGDESEDAVLRVELEAVSARHELERAQGRLDQALTALTAAVGDPGLAFGHLQGELGSAFELPSLAELLSRLEANPTLLAANAGSEAARARFDLARDLASPDVDLGLAYRRTEAGNDSIDVQFTVPLRVSDRGQGRITEARAGILDAQARERSARLALETDARGAWQRADAAWRHLSLLEDEVLPRAERLLEQSALRYDAGDIPLDELLRLRARWAGVGLDHLDALHETMLAWVELTAFLTEAP
jgi:cobalt-zinc-cadmium efflux system outer membrane protein